MTVKTLSLLVAVLFASRLALAAEPDSFELHAVAKAANEHAKEYSLPGRDHSPETVWLDTAVLLDHTALADASVEYEQDEPRILIKLTAEGRQRFGEITTKYLDRRVGIVLNGQLCSAPVIKSPIFGGSVQISGNFSVEEAMDLVTKLNRSIAR